MKRIALWMFCLMMSLTAAALEPAGSEDEAVRVVRQAGIGKVLKVQVRETVYRVRVLTPQGVVKTVDVPRKGE